MAATTTATTTTGKVAKPRKHTQRHAATVLTFNSRSSGDTHKLSNLFEHPLEWEGLLYPSVEHAYQATKVVPDQRAQFGVGARFGDWTGFGLVSKKNVAFWQKGDNIGIVAKLVLGSASAIGRAERQFGLQVLPDRSADEQYLRALFAQLLDHKFRDPSLRALLLSTAPRRLVELPLRGQPSKWNARVSVTGEIVGGNLMGECLEACRERVQRETTA